MTQVVDIYEAKLPLRRFVRNPIIVTYRSSVPNRTNFSIRDLIRIEGREQRTLLRSVLVRDRPRLLRRLAKKPSITVLRYHVNETYCMYVFYLKRIWQPKRKGSQRH